jgi:hypothetical protein
MKNVTVTNTSVTVINWLNVTVWRLWLWRFNINCDTCVCSWINDCDACVCDCDVFILSCADYFVTSFLGFVSSAVKLQLDTQSRAVRAVKVVPCNSRGCEIRNIAITITITITILYVAYHRESSSSICRIKFSQVKFLLDQIKFSFYKTR